MSTDGSALIEFVHPRPLVGPRWAEINLARDYALFDLISGGRSDDPSDALFPPRALEPGADGWTGTTWLWAAELDTVAVAYRQKTGRATSELEAIAAAMHCLNGADPQGSRCIFRFF